MQEQTDMLLKRYMPVCSFCLLQDTEKIDVSNEISFYQFAGKQIVMKKYFYAMKDIEGSFNIVRCS